MTTTSQRKTKAQKGEEQTAQIHALGVLHRLYWEKYLPLAVHDAQLSDEVYHAFRTLTRTIHGEPSGLQFGTLCDECHEAYHTHWVEQPTTFPSIRSCCTACKEKLLAEGKLLKVNGDLVAVQESEVKG